ncbi:hypothetical protein VT84_03435 [Gemmata sp. SH-PL17]|uniref:hypothetical protein n=1 Tax=Gemmata sp. SH-PL17 TaxID=1630693 RepID=UPI00078CA6EF|nr:hypothetical protein [Gemmata sp. SH-PL17]AMV23436.1 hypothetical protein VT84_03435 [Gemmata sp. SH-PL17]
MDAEKRRILVNGFSGHSPKENGSGGFWLEFVPREPQQSIWPGGTERPVAHWKARVDIDVDSAGELKVRDHQEIDPKIKGLTREDYEAFALERVAEFLKGSSDAT